MSKGDMAGSIWRPLLVFLLLTVVLVGAGHEELCPSASKSTWVWIGLGVILMTVAAAGLGLWWGKRDSQRRLTESYRAELDSQLTAQHFDYFIKYANDIVILTDSDDNILEVNDAAVAAYGYSRAALLKMSIRDLRAPEALASYEEQRLQVARSPHGMIYETVNRRRDGSTFPIEVNSHLLEVNGKVYRQGIVRDISERKRSEQALRLRDRAMAACRNGILITDVLQPDNPIIYANPAFERMTGYSRQEVLGRNCRFLQNDDRQQEGLAALRAAIRQGREHQAVLRNYKKDGTLFWNELSLAPVRDEQGRLTHYIGVLDDITERKQAEETLHQSYSQRTAILDSIPDMAWLKDREGRFIAVNETIAKSIGLSPDAMVGKTDLDFYPVELAERYRTDDLAVMESGKMKRVEEPYTEMSGTHWVETIKVPVLDDAGQVIGTSGIARDITDRKQAEQTLRESETRFRDLLAMASDWFWEQDQQFRFTYFSEGVEQSDFSAKEFLGKTRWELSIDPASADWPGHRRLLEAHQPFRGFEYRVALLSGRDRWFSVSGRPLFDASGRFVGYRGTGRDITRRKQAEEQLRLHTRVLEATANGIVITDPDGIIEWANPAFTELTGYAAAEAIGQSPRILKSGWHDKTYYQHLWDTILAGGAWHGEIINRRKDGSLYNEEMTITPVLNPQGDIDHFIAIKQDISQRIEAQAKLMALNETLRQSELRFRQMAETIGEIFWLVSSDFQSVRYVSPAFEQIWGRSREALYANPKLWLEAIHPDDAPTLERALEKLIRGQPYTIEFRIVRPDGAVRWINDRGYARCDGEGRVILISGVASDITDRKNAEAEREALHRQLVQASRQAGMAEVATGVLHNLGNVINSVNVSVSLMADNLRTSRVADLGKAVRLLQEHVGATSAFLGQGGKGSRILDYLAALTKHFDGWQRGLSNELRGIIANVDHIKLIISQQQQYAVGRNAEELVELDEVIDTALSMNIASHHGIEIVRDYDPLPPFTADRHKLLQILVNLVGNAKQALREGGAAAKRLELRSRLVDGHLVRIEVADNGVGIAAENLTKIFGFGFTTRVDGHGFGLHASANLAREMGGRLSCYSQGIGQGATFVLELPVQEGGAGHA